MITKGMSAEFHFNTVEIYYSVLNSGSKARAVSGSASSGLIPPDPTSDFLFVSSPFKRSVVERFEEANSVVASKERTYLVKL